MIDAELQGAIYPQSVVEHEGLVCFLARSAAGERVLVVRGGDAGFAGSAHGDGLLLCPCTPENAASVVALYLATASSLDRSAPNFEMSAPDTNALPPAPVSTTARTSASLRKPSRMSRVAAHISIDTALCRSGLLKIT